MALLPAARDAIAQTLALRGAETDAGFPTSPSSTPPTSPEDNTPPSTDVTPVGGDDDRPSGAPDQEASDGTSASDIGLRKTTPNLYRPAPKLYRPNAKTSPPLSPLVPYRTAATLRRGANQPPAGQNTSDPTQPAPTVAVLPAPVRQSRPPAEVDPYAATGVRLGQMIFKPFLETSTGYETNPNQVAVGVRASPVLRASGGFDAASDFSSGSLTASLRGGYSEFPSNSNANRPDLSATIDGRVDVTRIDTIDTEARFSLSTQTPGSPLLAVANSVFITNRPSITSEGATLGGTHLFGPLSIGLKGTFDRTQYGDATQSDGTTVLFSTDNYNDYGVVAKAGYEITPGLVPFVELGFDQRVRDNPVDLSGYARNSVGGTGRAGATFNMFGYFTGTASAGYVRRHYDDPRLPDLTAPTLDGSLAYAATPLTTITLRASTAASETTLAGASGAISRTFSAEIAHVLFRNFTVSGIATVQPNEYQGVSGHETYTTFTLKGAYDVSRDIQLIASASHQNLSSTFLGQGFKDDVFLVGVRLKR
jgi:hypothetical protein